jgi:hypothetical protein
MQIREEETEPGCLFVGMTPNRTTGTDETKWQIKRVTYENGEIVTLYANNGKWNNVWDNKETYFPSCNPDGPFPADSVITGEVQLVGLSTEGRVTHVPITNAAWTPIPAAALGGRQSIALQNFTGGDVRLNWDNTKPLTEGVILANGNERYYTVAEGLTLYAVHTSLVAATIIAEELA